MAARILSLPLLRGALFLSSHPPLPLLVAFSPRPSHLQQYQFQRKLVCCTSLHVEVEETPSFSSIQAEVQKRGGKSGWKPMCLYNTQGKCAKMNDPSHLERFNHSFSVDRVLELEKLRTQEFDYFLVLDLEGKVEILEFPVLLFDVKTMDVVDVFHRFVRPTRMSEARINEYIEGKYGAFGVDGVWHETAIAFIDVIEQFEAWLDEHKLWRKDRAGHLNDAAFVTCGNWDLKTSIPRQCVVANMKLPSYFMQWINVKDIFLNFYNTRAPGMLSMMRELQIHPLGSHHLGIDDSRNIVRVLQRMLMDGAFLQLTARRSRNSLDTVEFLFKNRIQ